MRSRWLVVVRSGDRLPTLEGFKSEVGSLGWVRYARTDHVFIAARRLRLTSDMPITLHDSAVHTSEFDDHGRLSIYCAKVTCDRAPFLAVFFKFPPHFLLNILAYRC